MYKCENCKKEYKDILTHKRYCDKFYFYKDDVIEMYSIGLSIKSISDKLKISKCRVISFLEGETRSISESAKLAHKMFPEKFKHSEETKKKMSEKRLKWLKENPEKTAWRQSNMSYPENLFLNKIIELGWDKDHLVEREKSIYPYFIDFAFVNEKVAVEIDGSQHLLPERMKSDVKKDKLLKYNGWRVIRITTKEVNSNLDDFLLKLKSFLKSDIKYEKVGILTESKKYIKKDRSIYRFTKPEKYSQLRQRKIERPPLDQLLKEVSELGYSATGRKYNVSDNSIRKWIKMYQKHGEKF